MKTTDELEEVKRTLLDFIATGPLAHPPDPVALVARPKEQPEISMVKPHRYHYADVLPPVAEERSQRDVELV